jgi:DNA-binding response OmpR family regulator/anti-sigma regulatory factor (Ser/Thr protein kinase)
MARILIAEDSPDIRALVQMLLEADGHDVEAVADGRAAVSAARAARPDLILMDLSLPILSGWEAARQIRSDPASASIPILAVTAHAMQGDRERALAAGCDGFIAKPIDEETFAERILGFLERPAPQASLPTPAGGTPPLGPGRVLVVDDQPEVAELLRGDLEADGHSVAVATSAAQAAALFDGGGAFDLAVIDVMLGADSGYALTASITSRAAEYIPVLLVTAGTIDRERGFAAGADDFIGKPIETVELRARARSLIRVGRAIREQGRIGRERSEAYRRLEELDHLKSGFLSTVSHELRTPLNTIILLAHQLEKRLSRDRPSDRHDRDVRVLRDAAERLRRMIDNILDLAKLEGGQRDLHPEAVEVREFLQENLDLLEPQAREKRLELVLDVDPATPATFSLDREKVSRVLVNLLSNAVKYTSSGRVVLAGRPWQQSLTIEVRDTGVGISPDLIGKAFEPFNQIRTRNESAPGGTGLGLSISKQLVELMGGDLILESREGEGTTVSFTVPPLQSADPSAGVPERKPSAAGSVALVGGRRARVLVVEDDDPSRYGMAALLDSEGYAVAMAGTLDAADESLADGDYDAIILDITLPDGDGATWLARRVRRATPTPPVLALTGVASDEDTRRILEAGVRHVLTKPVNVTRLLLALRETLTEPERPQEESAPAS